MVDHNHDQLSVREQCQLLHVNRSTLYVNQEEPRVNKNYDIMVAIDMQFLKTPFYGSRRMTAHLRYEGYVINRKKVARLMKEMGLIAIYPPPNLSKRNHQHKVYPYLLKGLNIDRPNYVWSIDITYIPTRDGHVYLAAIIDWYTKKIIAWKLSTTLDSQFCIEMIEEAFETEKPEILNSDQGCQFTSHAYIDLLTSNGVSISMDSKGRALDNVMIERFWRSLKQEKLYRNECATVADVRRLVKEYVKFYNDERPHQTLEYQFPSVFHAQTVAEIQERRSRAFEGAIAA